MIDVLLRQVPEALKAKVLSGDAVVFGGVIRDAANGQIMAHLQQTGGSLVELVGRALPFDPLSAVMSGFEIAQNQHILHGVEWLQNAMQMQMGMSGVNLLSSIFSVVQNVQIKARLEDMNATLLLVQGLQVAEMIGSGLMMGVGILNQTMMRRRLESIERGIDRIGERLDQVEARDRRRRIGILMREIHAQVEISDSLSVRRQPHHAAATVEGHLSNSVARLTEELEERLDDLPAGRTDAAAAVAEAHRIAQAIQVGRASQFQTLFEVDEPAAAAQLSDRHTSEARRIAWLVEPVEILSRTGAADDAGGAAETAHLVAQTVTLMDALLATARTTLGNSLLAGRLANNGWSSRAYLAEARRSEAAPVMMLADHDAAAKSPDAEVSA